MNLFKDILINADVLNGRYISLKQPAYIEEDIPTDGAGVYSSEEWTKARSSGYRDAGENSSELDSNESYLSRILTKHSRNTLASLRLLRTFEFQSYGSILELGCGEMVQAFVIKSAYPRIRYRATDFDPFIVDKCSRLSILDGLEKDVLDVAGLSAEMLHDFDLLISWEMDYALDNDKLLAILRSAKEANVPYLTCNTQYIGLIKYLVRKVKNLSWRPGGLYYKRMIEEGKMRMHGRQCSIGYYRRLAEQAGMSLSSVAVPPLSRPLEDNFVYCLLTP